MEHEASTSKIGEDQIFYCKQRGLSAEDAVSMIVNGFCKEVFKELPMEFAVEAQNLLGNLTRRERRMTDTVPLLEIKDLHASVEGKEILRGVSLQVRSRRGARGDGTERLGEEHRSPRCWPAIRPTP